MTTSTVDQFRHRHHHRPFRMALQVTALVLAASLAACGGGSNETSGGDGGTGSGGGSTGGGGTGGGGSSGGGGSTPTLSQRIAAATETADSHPDCAAEVLGPYYWEIGTVDGMQGSGRVGGSDAPSRTTTMNIFSASKWLYAASVVERRGVVDDDVPYLNFSSGYSTFGNFKVCVGDTVGTCQLLPIEQDASTIGRFSYDSGHMQQHASAVMGLGDADNAGLARYLRDTLGDFGFTFGTPQLASGVIGSAAGYAGFLQRMLAGDLAITRALGTRAICTNPDVPGCNAHHVANAGATEDMDYSLGHWVESDPSVGGDGSFNSVGGGGFYPWIDPSLKYYGILARESVVEADGAAHNSLVCGRLIRKAWMTGSAITS